MKELFKYPDFLPTALVLLLRFIFTSAEAYNDEIPVQINPEQSVGEKKTLQVGESDFRKIIENNFTYIDKTELIREIMNDGSPVILITRPRKFGKTTNLSMMKYFLSVNSASVGPLFENLKISEDSRFCETHQNKYPVIYLSFKDVKGKTFSKAESRFKRTIIDLYEHHDYLLTGNSLRDAEKKKFQRIINEEATEAHYCDAVYQLSKFLKRFHKKNVVLLLDEYDTPILHAYQYRYDEEMVPLMTDVLSTVLKDNFHLEKAIITGVNVIGKESLLSSLNNVAEYTVLNDETYGAYYGFTQPEVKELLSAQNKNKLLADIEKWYSGYHIGHHLIFNPWSVLSFLKRSKLRRYWPKASNDDMVRDVISKSGISTKIDFEQLLKNEVVGKTIHMLLSYDHLMDDENEFWTLLVHWGYLTVKDYNSDREQAYLRIPNQEINGAFLDFVRHSFKSAPSDPEYHRFLTSVQSGNESGISRCLSIYLRESGVFHDFSKVSEEESMSKIIEKAYHAYILSLLFGLRNTYDIRAHAECGKGRCDILLIPKKGIATVVIDFKLSRTKNNLVETVESILEEMETKECTVTARQHNSEKLVLIGIAFHKKDFEVRSKIIQVTSSTEATETSLATSEALSESSAILTTAAATAVTTNAEEEPEYSLAVHSRKSRRRWMK